MPKSRSSKSLVDQEMGKKLCFVRVQLQAIIQHKLGNNGNVHHSNQKKHFMFSVRVSNELIQSLNMAPGYLHIPKTGYSQRR